MYHCTLTPPLSHFTLTLIASDMPFSARPSPLPEGRVDSVRKLFLPYLRWLDCCTKQTKSILPCSQPWRRSCCSANFKPRLFSCTTSAIYAKDSLWNVRHNHRVLKLKLNMIYFLFFFCSATHAVISSNVWHPKQVGNQALVSKKSV